jgi:benzodiazapine receptor
MTLKRLLAFVICVAIPLAVAALSGYLTAGEVEAWLPTLRKPSFYPPNSVFGPVWTTLYTLMGISLFMIWNSPDRWPRRKALTVFFLQLFLNFSWSITFFNLHLLFFAIIDIIVLWAMILYMIYSFKDIKPIAAWLNVPYLLWVSFATVLTIAIWKLN